MLSSAVALLFLSATGVAAGAEQPEVRLLVGENMPRTVVRATSMVIQRWESGRWQDVLGEVRAAAFTARSHGVRLEGSDLASSLFRVRPLSGLLQANGKYQRGFLTISASGGSLMLVATMPLESYLVGVVNGEVDSAWPEEAVKAQVVAARTYALHQIARQAPLYDLRTDFLHQVYAGVGAEDERAWEAVRSTRGEAVYWQGELVPAFFHSTCGGATATASEVWGIGHPALVSVTCEDCRDSPYYRWQSRLTVQELREAVRTLYPAAGRVRSLGIHRRTSEGRILTLFIQTDTGRILVDAGDLRKVLGYRRLPGTRFTMGLDQGDVVLTGSGYGHGVGLCQWGARGSALKGMDYRQILGRYYPGSEVRRAF
ncbi:MAG: SpoIID/LytB domain-containing protein [bacterium]|nr:MAG: SpoIID/LytB domain-containing protein [bacterium]